MDLEFNSNTIISAIALIGSWVGPWIAITRNRKDNNRDVIVRIIEDELEGRQERDAQKLKEAMGRAFVDFKSDLMSGLIQVSLSPQAYDNLQYRLQQNFDKVYVGTDRFNDHVKYADKRFESVDNSLTRTNNSIQIFKAGLMRLLNHFSLKLPKDPEDV